MSIKARFPGNMVANGKFYGTPLTVAQRALRRAGYKKIRANGYYGSNTRNAIKAIQKNAGLPQTGNIGARVWRRLDDRYINDTEAKQINLFVKRRAERVAKKKAAETAKRQQQKEALSRDRYVTAIRKAAFTMINNRGSIHYTQGPMRMQGVRHRIRLPDFPRWEDCSSSVTWLFWQAGLPDPNGLGYNGYGFTGTLNNNGHSISASELQPGDLVFYGPGERTHVACVLTGSGYGAGCFSHGSEWGPLYVRANYRYITEARRYF